jgi:hypothetical protein
MYQLAYEDRAEFSEMSAYKLHTSGKYPDENIQPSNLSNLRPSVRPSFRTLSRDNTFLRLLKLSLRSSDMFR